MIREKLVSQLTREFADRGLRLETEGSLVATLPAANAAVGDVRVFDEEYEARVEIGDLTHGHFGPVDGPDDDASEMAIVEAVCEFLHELVSNQVVLWRDPNGSGGWVVEGEDGDEVGPAPTSGRQVFRWSGPVGEEGRRTRG